MRYLIGLLLALILLAGCASGKPAVTVVSTSTQPVSLPAETVAVPEETDPPVSGQPSGTYIQNGAAEQNSGGAVREYAPGVQNVTGLLFWGDHLLLLSGCQRTTLTVLEGEQLAVGAQITLDTLLSMEGGAVQVQERGVAFYDGIRRCMVFLNWALNETGRIQLPEQMLGGAVVSPDWGAVYYCTAEGVHTMDMRTGIDRLLKEQTAAFQSIRGLYFDGTVLGCFVKTGESDGKTIYLSAQTGETLHDNKTLDRLTTSGESYLAQLRDGSVEICLMGKGEREPQTLLLPEGTAPVPALQLGGVVLKGADGILSFVGQESGQCTARISVRDLGDVLILNADAQKIWFMGAEETGEAARLYSWEPALSPVQDKTDYFNVYYTAENPDAAGLAQCQAQADALGEEHGVTILLWENTLACQPWDYTLVPEYRVEAYRRDLTILEQSLGKFPEGFFQTLTSGTDNGSLTICLVRALKGGGEMEILENAGGAQYWIDGSAYIILALGDGLEQTLYHEISHVIDNRVISTSKAYDDWEYLNPGDFAYDYDYADNLYRDGAVWLDEEKRQFIDTYSMSFPKEDRARILEYAMMPGNESYFISETMQEKLDIICRAIREVFSLEDDTPYSWEQYLVKE